MPDEESDEVSDEDVKAEEEVAEQVSEAKKKGIVEKAVEAGQETYQKAEKAAGEAFDTVTSGHYVQDEAKKAKGWIDKKLKEREANKEVERQWSKEQRIEKLQELKEKRAALREQESINRLQREINKSGGGSTYDRIRGRKEGGELSPFAAAMQGKGQQESPFWMRGTNEQPGYTKQRNAPESQTGIMRVVMGQGQTRNQQAPRQKTVIINGRRYVVQGEQNQEYQQAPPQPAIMQGLMGHTQYPTNQRRAEQSHISPLMQATLGGHGNPHQSNSPLMQAVISPHATTAKREKRSPLSNALEGGTSSSFSFTKKRGWFKL